MLNGTKIVAVCTSRIHDGATFDFVNELNNLLVEQNCRVFVYHICSDFYWENLGISADSAIFDLIDYRVADAVVIMDEKVKSQKITDKIIQDAKSNNVPVLIIDKIHPDGISLCFDYKKGFEKIVRHVIEDHKVRRPHFMAGIKGNQFSEDRQDVFKQVIEENGISFDESMVSYGRFWANPTREAMYKLIEQGNLPEAIICANDIMAINVCAVLEEYGYCIPEDIIVTGFDGIDEIEFMRSPLTSARCDYVQMATKVYELLLDCFLGWNVPKEHWVIPSLIKNASCGCQEKQIVKDINFYNRMNTRFYRYQDDIKKLSDISQKMQNCDTLEEMSELLSDSVLDQLSILVNESCIDETKNTNDLGGDYKFENKFVLLHHAEDKTEDLKFITREDIYVTFERILDKKVPILFNAISTLDCLFGYICFYFNQPDLTNYGKVTQIVTSMTAGVSGYMNVKNQKYLHKKLEDIYKYDSLTGLLNRKGFNLEFPEVKEKVLKNNGSIIAVLSDLDRLKMINDTYGHVVGDRAIVEIANALKYACPEDALVVRLGGDEMFAVISDIPENSDKSSDIKSLNKEERLLNIKLNIYEKVAQYLDKFNRTGELECKISSSLGIYITDLSSEMNFDFLVQQADKKLYEQKEEHHKSS